MSELGLVEYFSMAEALGIIATVAYSPIFLKETNTGPISRYRNKGSQRFGRKNARTCSDGY